MRQMVRRAFVFGLLFLSGGGFAKGSPLGDLATIAATKGPVIWYESASPEQIAQVSAAFNKKYPGIKIQFVRNAGGNSLAAKVIQEVQANSATASLISGDVKHVEALHARGLLIDRNWSELGVSVRLTPTRYAIATTATVFSIIWNKNKVSSEQSPKTWSDLLKPEWKKRLGHWVRSAPLANLGATLGEDVVRKFVADLAAQKPALFPSSFPLAQQVAAGEVDVAIIASQAAIPPRTQGAPIEERFLDPTPVNTIYSGVVSKGGNPEGAQVLAAWLTTPEGAIAYEAATGRGNPIIEGTQASKLVAGRRLSEWPFDQTATYEKLETELAELLANGASSQ